MKVKKEKVPKKPSRILFEMFCIFAAGIVLFILTKFIPVKHPTPDFDPDPSILDELEEEESLNFLENLDGPYDVVSVTDGDTFSVNINGEKTKIRLIGVNTPESVAPDEDRNCEEGKVASREMKSLLNGKKVYLEFDKEREDKYGRTLAYAYLEDGTMINKYLLEKGYAEVMTIEPNTKYAAEFSSIENAARKNQVGFWTNPQCWEK